MRLLACDGSDLVLSAFVSSGGFSFFFLFLLLDFFYSFTEEGNSMGSDVMQRTTYNEWGLEGERKGKERKGETERQTETRETASQKDRQTDRQTYLS